MQRKINIFIKKEDAMELKNVDAAGQDSRASAIACLLEICGDPEARSADRVAAAKLLLELDCPREDAGTITVIMEGVEKEYCR